MIEDDDMTGPIERISLELHGTHINVNAQVAATIRLPSNLPKFKHFLGARAYREIKCWLVQLRNLRTYL